MTPATCYILDINYQEKFGRYWIHLYPDITLQANKVVVPGTRYVFDYVHRESKVIIEVCPNPWGTKEYNRRKYQKYFLAAYHDWLVLALGEDMVNRKFIRMIYELIVKRTNEFSRQRKQNA